MDEWSEMFYLIFFLSEIPLSEIRCYLKLDVVLRSVEHSQSFVFRITEGDAAAHTALSLSPSRSPLLPSRWNVSNLSIHYSTQFHILSSKSLSFSPSGAPPLSTERTKPQSMAGLDRRQ